LSGFFRAGETPFPQLESPVGQGKAPKACRAVVLALCARTIPVPIASTDIENKIANDRWGDMSTSLPSLKLDTIEAAAAVASRITIWLQITARSVDPAAVHGNFLFDASN
jgi:hypothetical protein